MYRRARQSTIMQRHARLLCVLFALGLLLLFKVHARGLLQSQEQKYTAPTQADVIIIGAGISGITTAVTLFNETSPASPPPKVIILEARDRAGGRLYSVDTVVGRVDEGAMWIHDGVPGNPLYDLAVSLNLSLSLQLNYFSASTFAVDGQYSDSNLLEMAALYESFAIDMLGSIEAMRNDPAMNSPEQDVAIIDLYNAYIAKENYTQAEIPRTNLMAHTYFQTLLNGNMTRLSSLRYGDAKTLPAIDVHLRDGFDAITESLKQGLDIRYSTPVAKISQTDQGVTVTAQDGTVYDASYVVVTASLGCLKAAQVEFEPALPESKLKAIDQMGMGVLDKVILVYDAPFWNETDFISREMPDLGGEWAIYLNYVRTLDMPVLVALNAADTAIGLEEKTDNELLASVLAVLRSMYGEEVVPEPTEYYVTRWATDPWALGSYSYYAVGNDKNITGRIGEPAGRVLFAGEATSEFPATVLGAYTSGIREGERLKDMLSVPGQIKG